jgi:hypothetical protein
MRPKRLVILSEGHGDVLASHVIVDRLLKERHPWEHLFLDRDVIRVGGIERLTGKPEHKINWLNRLGIAQKRGDLGATLLLLDGDCEKVEGKAFCAKEVAVTLADRARAAGAGQVFSLACVFAVSSLNRG